MIRKYTLCTLVSLTLILLSISAIATGFARAKLGNGLTVLVIEDHSTDLVAIDIWVNAGSVYETKVNNGVSHLIEHLLFAGSNKYQPGEVDVEAESLGANLDAHTTRDWARFSTSVATRFFTQAMSLLSETVLGPTFPEDALRREKMVILDEIARKQSMSRKVCDDALWSATAKSHPYSLPVEGTPETIKAMTRQQISDYYQTLYTADNTVVVVVGDVVGQSAVQYIGKLFQDMPRISNPPVIPEFVYSGNESVETLSFPGKLGCVGVGFAGPPAFEYADVCAVDLLLAYMGYGYKSWMEENLVTKTNLSYDASADFLTHRYPGLLSLIAAGRNPNLIEIKDTILARIAGIIKDGITESELIKAKRSLLGQFAFQNETFSGRANTYGFYDRISKAEFGDTYIESIQAINNEDIKRVASKYMAPKTAKVVIIKAKD